VPKPANWISCEHCVIGKKIKVKFGTTTHCTERILNYVHIDI